MKRLLAAAGVVVLASVSLLALSTVVSTPRLAERPGVLPGDLMQVHIAGCLSRTNPAMVQRGVTLEEVAGAYDIDVHGSNASGGATARQLEAWEQQLEVCVNEFRRSNEPEPYLHSDSEFDLTVQYLYYTGPLTACLRERGIEPLQPLSLEEFRSRTFPINPYWMMEGESEQLLDVYRDCPPFPDILVADP